MKTKLTLVFAILTNLLCYSQDLPKIIPPSPNAASLGQYADIPVGNYTGVPNVEIPLFNVKSGKIDLPISLSYHASGIKVAQEASLVGLGWALNAGGVITRQVRGFDDFLFNGYINRPLPPSTEANLPDWSGDNFPIYMNTYYPYLDSNDLATRVDGEPDIFYYNFMGYSGKLVFEQQVASTDFRGVSIDQNNLIFSYNRVLKEWTVTDGKGWKYFLGRSDLHSIERTETSSYTSINSPIKDVYPSIVNNRMVPQSATTEKVDTAWYLTKVITPEGEIIEFIYDSTHYETYGQLNYSEKNAQLAEQTITGTVTTVPPSTVIKGMYSVSQQMVEDVYLKKIKYVNGTIDFITESRDDLRRINTYYSKPQRLKSVEQFDLKGKSIKKIDFNYSYFNGNMAQNNPITDATYLRLCLDSIQESYKEGSVYLKKPSYVFSYNQTVVFQS